MYTSCIRRRWHCVHVNNGRYLVRLSLPTVRWRRTPLDTDGMSFVGRIADLTRQRLNGTTHEEQDDGDGVDEDAGQNGAPLAIPEKLHCSSADDRMPLSLELLQKNDNESFGVTRISGCFVFHYSSMRRQPKYANDSRSSFICLCILHTGT